MSAPKFEIVKHPDETLSQKALPVDSITSEIEEIIQKMITTLSHTRTGIGLAANQVGVLKRILIVAATSSRTPTVMINPVIVKTSKTTSIDDEGCLSFPGKFVKVERYDWIKVRYLDANGVEHSPKLRKLEARCVQHELDHLDGINLPDRAIGVEKSSEFWNPKEKPIVITVEEAEAIRKNPERASEILENAQHED